MDSDIPQIHIKLSKGQVRPIVLAVGDPQRAYQFAKMCQSYHELANNREYRSFHCKNEGVEFTIISHGVGAAGAAICFEELIAAGAKLIIRAGTAGSLGSHMRRGDILIAMAAVRDEGVTPHLVPLAYPAVASLEVCEALMNSAKSLNVEVSKGIVLTTDVYYNSMVLSSNLAMYSKANVKAVAMEESTLFVIGSLKNVLTGVILTIDGNPLTGDFLTSFSEELETGKTNMAKICFGAITKLSMMFK